MHDATAPDMTASIALGSRGGPCTRTMCGCGETIRAFSGGTLVATVVSIMPTSTEILAGLTRIANDALPIAIIWHLMLAAGFVALLGGWRPSNRTGAVLATLPVASAALLAALFGNPFNALVLGATTTALLLIALRLDARPIEISRSWTLAAAVVVLVFGWFYPHFLSEHPLWTYAYGAPVGLVPCPSLSVAISLGLLATGFHSRAWSTVLAFVGLFYALFGALRLGVVLDLGLLAGSMSLLALALLSDLRTISHGGHHAH